MEGKSKLNFENYKSDNIKQYFGKWFDDKDIQNQFLKQFKEVKTISLYCY